MNPLLVLRNALCSGRWAEAWAAVASGRREAVRARQAAQRQERRARTASRAVASSGPSGAVDVLVVAAVAVLLTEACEPVQVSPAAAPLPPASGGERQSPAANHPWRHSPIGKACADPPHPLPSAKL